MQLLGCGGSTADVNVRVPEKDRPDIDATAVAAGRRTVPAEHAFNIVKYASGQDGKSAQGGASALEGHGAMCQANVTGEGSAWGAFQLGYTFDNTTGSAIDAAIRLNISVGGKLDHKSKSPETGAQPTGSASLNFVVKDTLGVVVRQEALYTAEIGSGAKEEGRKHDVVFEARLEPNRGYYILIAGRADAAAVRDGQSAFVAVEASEVSVEIDWKLAAPTTQAAGR